MKSVKGSCYLATKSDLDEIDVNTVVCYALVILNLLIIARNTLPLRGALLKLFMVLCHMLQLVCYNFQPQNE
jgi:hypothetical protein